MTLLIAANFLGSVSAGLCVREIRQARGVTSSGRLRIRLGEQRRKGFACARCLLGFGLEPFRCDFKCRASGRSLFATLASQLTFLQKLFLQWRVFLNQFCFTHIHHRIRQLWFHQSIPRDCQRAITQPARSENPFKLKGEVLPGYFSVALTLGLLNASSLVSVPLGYPGIPSARLVRGASQLARINSERSLAQHLSNAHPVFYFVRAKPFRSQSGPLMHHLVERVAPEKLACTDSKMSGALRCRLWPTWPVFDQFTLALKINFARCGYWHCDCLRVWQPNTKISE